jgi:hypothetical protein
MKPQQPVVDYHSRQVEKNRFAQTDYKHEDSFIHPIDPAMDPSELGVSVLFRGEPGRVSAYGRIVSSSFTEPDSMDIID